MIRNIVLLSIIKGPAILNLEELYQFNNSSTSSELRFSFKK